MAALDRAELRRWALSIVVVLGLHAAGAAVLMTWQDPLVAGEASDAIMVDLAPLANAAIDAPDDIAPGPKQQETEEPPPEPEKTEQKFEEKIEIPPSPAPAIAALPPPQELKPERPKPKPLPPVPTTTAPQRQRTASLTVVNSWHSRIVGLIERNKAYPPAAQARGETGVVQLAFSIDRQGHVLASQVVRSSGHAALDQETLATVRRAQPFPPPPVDLPGAKFDFTVPVRFNIR
jgi:periplasmic protein TonB